MSQKDKLVSKYIEMGMDPILTNLLLDYLAKYYGDEFQYISPETDLSREMDPEDMEVIFKSISKKLNWTLPPVKVQLNYLNETPCKVMIDYIKYLEFLSAWQN